MWGWTLLGRGQVQEGGVFPVVRLSGSGRPIGGPDIVRFGGRVHPRALKVGPAGELGIPEVGPGGELGMQEVGLAGELGTHEVDPAGELGVPRASLKLASPVSLAFLKSA